MFLADNERAKEVLKELKSKHEEFNNSFEDVVKKMVKDLEIPERIARQIVLDQLASDNAKQLILYDIFSPSVLEKNNIKRENK